MGLFGPAHSDPREVAFRKKLAEAVDRKPFIRAGDDVAFKGTGKKGFVVESEDTDGTGPIVVSSELKSGKKRFPSNARYWDLLS